MPRESLQAPALPYAAYGEHQEDDRDGIVEVAPVTTELAVDVAACALPGFHSAYPHIAHSISVIVNGQNEENTHAH